MGSENPVAGEDFQRAFRQITDARMQLARRHEVTHAALARAKTRRDRIRELYAQLERTAAGPIERLVTSRRILLDALTEMSADIRETCKRLDEIGDDSQTHRETLSTILDRLKEFEAEAPGHRLANKRMR